MIFWNELKKIVLFPALWGFMAVIIAFNFFLVVFGDCSDTTDYINAVSAIAGEKYSEDYKERINAIIPPDDEHDMDFHTHAQLVSSADNFSVHSKEYLDGFLDSFKKEEWIKQNSFNTKILSLLEDKYEKAKAELARKNASGESSYVLFADETSRIIGYATETLGRAMLAEAIIVSMLIVLFSVSYEQLSNSDLLIYSTKVGRKKLAKNKLATSFAVSSAAYFLIFGFGFGAYFSVNGFSEIFGSPISSAVNYSELLYEVFPFIAWSSLSVGGFFILTVLLGFLIMLIFFLLAAAVGFVLKDSFIAFGVIAFAALLNIAPMFMAPSSLLIYFAVFMLPAGTVFSMPAWFQYGANSTLIPYQEAAVTLIWLLISVALLTASTKYFIKKDIK